MKSWTKELENDLIFGIQIGLSYKEIGEVLGKSTNAIRLKSNRLSLKYTKSSKRTHDQYERELAEKCPTMIVLEAYKGANISILHKCLNCNTQYKVSPNSKLKGHNCKYCPKAKKTQKQYERELAEKCPTMICLDTYINIMTPILHRCIKCNTEYKCLPCNKLKGFGCKYCGHKHCNGGILASEEPGITYLVYFYEIDLYKIGVTSVSVKNRLSSIGHKYLIILQHSFSKGKDAMKLEKLWLNNVAKYRINTGLLNNGNTETFKYS